MMRTKWRWVLFLLLFVPQSAWAHGEGDGLPTLLEPRQVGPYEVSVAGDLKIGVSPLAIHVDIDGEPVDESVVVSVEASHVGGATVVSTAAARLEDEYLAVLSLQESGQWSLRILIRGAEWVAETTLTTRIAPPQPQRDPVRPALLILLPLAALLLTLGVLRQRGIVLLSRDSKEKRRAG